MPVVRYHVVRPDGTVVSRHRNLREARAALRRAQKAAREWRRPPDARIQPV